MSLHANFQFTEHNGNVCSICGRLADSQDDKQLCAVCFRFLSATSPLSIEAKMMHLDRHLETVKRNMFDYLLKNYGISELEDSSYFDFTDFKMKSKLS